MFAAEFLYARAKRKSRAKAQHELQLDQRHWHTDESSSPQGIYVPERGLYAQNEAYVELCNPAWEVQWRTVFGGAVVTVFALFIIWAWYGFAVHPLLFGKFIMFWRVVDYEPWRMNSFGTGFGWLLLFPLALGAAALLYGWYIGMGMGTSFFTYARGRIRFNRLTRKVYVLRPGYCGGNKVFDWNQLVALMRRVPEERERISKVIGSLVLYQPPTDPNDWRSEDAVFVGPSLYLGSQQAEPLWEYIRLYMEQGPTLDEIPQNPPDDFKHVVRYPPPRYFTYCGLPSGPQLGLELGLGFFDQFMHSLSQMTCSWPKFPKEWKSDSGLGEPEDRPVQTGAVMTALAYRAAGRLSAQDEMTLMERYGTLEGQAGAKARLAREQAEQPSA